MTSVYPPCGSVSPDSKDTVTDIMQGARLSFAFGCTWDYAGGRASWCSLRRQRRVFTLLFSCPHHDTKDSFLSNFDHTLSGFGSVPNWGGHYDPGRWLRWLRCKSVSGQGSWLGIMKPHAPGSKSLQRILKQRVTEVWGVGDSFAHLVYHQHVIRNGKWGRNCFCFDF